MYVCMYYKINILKFKSSSHNICACPRPLILLVLNFGLIIYLYSRY